MNCILDDILSTTENVRSFWFQLNEKGNMSIIYELTGKRHLITKEYFEKDEMRLSLIHAVISSLLFLRLVLLVKYLTAR